MIACSSKIYISLFLSINKSSTYDLMASKKYSVPFLSMNCGAMIPIILNIEQTADLFFHCLLLVYRFLIDWTCQPLWLIKTNSLDFYAIHRSHRIVWKYFITKFFSVFDTSKSVKNQCDELVLHTNRIFYLGSIHLWKFYHEQHRPNFPMI